MRLPVFIFLNFFPKHILSEIFFGKYFSEQNFASPSLLCQI